MNNDLILDYLLRVWIVCLCSVQVLWVQCQQYWPWNFQVLLEVQVPLL